ncbi:hypothetical protein BKA82DRAFT_22726 [Pisolithus tinctorius]|uniref:Uncharacterized protein n=1 Tax=Pisolithus tinctorius Marx 270 TaxID=870435 RepID=A0A0C3P6I7_PISTI|nr:hypothetical protein BKA82DRAFT_22726 [Pisolithus tinctorius]KIO08915.1 hypothetical protein M404DRAFT_22726 [Pisolithus tinctorius Marx 270]
MDEIHDRCRMHKVLWLRLIEGDVDDDVWLWADGDSEWLRSEEPDWAPRGMLTEDDWVSAESALRRRVNQRRYPLLTDRNQRVRSATPEQRLSVIAWLIASSKEVAELFTSHGHTPPTFSTPRIAFTLNGIVNKYWDGFPSQTSAWENAIAKAEEDGCICSPEDCYGMQQWFNMIVWLERKLPTLEVGYEPCEHCRSLVRSRYKDITTQHAVILDVSLLEAFFSYCSDFCGLEHALYRLSPTAKQMMDEKLEPLMKEHTLDMRYLPCVNKYPRPLRKHVARLSCAPPDASEWGLEDIEVPDNIVDGAHDPWEVLGLTAMVALGGDDETDTVLHDRQWHSDFSSFLRTFLTCFDMPVLPWLSSTGVRLCHELDQGYSEECLFSITVVFVAVGIFLRSNEIGVSTCPKCRAICMKFLADTSSSAGFEVIDSGNDTEGGAVPPSLQGSLEVSDQEPAGMEAFTTMLRSPTLLKDEVELRVVAELFKLQRKYLDSRGLNASNCFRRSGGDDSPCLESVMLTRFRSASRLTRNARDSTLLRRLPANSSSSGLPKSDKVEEIKQRLLDMLGELSLPYKRLPWSTLEQELEKNGYALVNWPTGVRKCGNKGIHDLSAVDVNKLYDAITCPDETRRLHIRRRPSALTVVPVQPVECTPPVASRSKRLTEAHGLHGLPSKRTRFEDMTSKVMQLSLSESRGDGATGP